MKESEFEEALFTQGVDRTSARKAKLLALTCGAVFEPDGMVELPSLYVATTGTPGRFSITGDRGAFLNYYHAAEVIRRCKAVEEAVAYARDQLSGAGGPVSQLTPRAVLSDFLAILEGRS